MFRVRPRALLPIAAALALAAPSPVLGAAGDTPDLKSTFEAKYQAWRDYRHRVLPLSSDIDIGRLLDNEPYRAIVRLGIPALPYMMQKLGQDPFIGAAIEHIARFTPHIRSDRTTQGHVWTVDEFPDVRRVGHPLDARALWLRWWKERRERTPVWFDQRYREWERLKREGKQDEAKQQYQLIVELGLEALPLMVETMKEGSSDLVPALSALTNGAVKQDAKPAECVRWWATNKEAWTLPPPESEEESDVKPLNAGR